MESVIGFDLRSPRSSYMISVWCVVNARGNSRPSWEGEAAPPALATRSKNVPRSGRDWVALSLPRPSLAR